MRNKKISYNLNNKPSLKILVFPFLIFSSFILIELPISWGDFDQFNCIEFCNEVDTKNSQKQNESSYELDLDDFTQNKLVKSQNVGSENRQYHHKNKHTPVIYLDTPNPPPELV